MPGQAPGAYVADAKVYVRGVATGKIPACKWVRLACARQQRDLARARRKDPTFPYRFDRDAAERVCLLIEQLPHIKGKWAKPRPGEPRPAIVLEPWQRFRLTTVFGWVHKNTGYRRFRTAYHEIPRKNGKSCETSGVGLYLAFCDAEEGAEVYSAATTREQARIVFRDAQRMARKSPEFRAALGVECIANNIHQLVTSSKFEAVSAEAKTLDGLNVHGGLVDELHAHKTREVFDVIETGTGSRTQSLLWLITTSGSDLAGICYEQRDYVTKILEQVIVDETYFGIIYTIDEGDSWVDPIAWRKANPNLGVSKYEDDLARLCAKARQTPAAQNNFKTKHLDVWCSGEAAWMNMEDWRACADPKLTREQFAGQRVWKGLDLASRIDIAAHVDVFKEGEGDEAHYFTFGRYYLPEATIAESRNSQYPGWKETGRLIATPGNIIDFSAIEDDLTEDASEIEVAEVAFDPHQATQFSTRMSEAGFTMVEVRPTVLNFSEPMKELEALVKSRRFHHDGCPVLTWMMSNVVVQLDRKDNIYPRKQREENKIDGVVSLIMALSRALVGDTGKSVYEERGIRQV